VRVAGRNDEGVDLVAGHRGAQGGKALGAVALEVCVGHGLRGKSVIQAVYDTPQL
jgi:hypothetical protein